MKKVKEKIVGYHAKFVNIMHTYRCQEIQRCELKMQKEILYGKNCQILMQKEVNLTEESKKEDCWILCQVC